MKNIIIDCDPGIDDALAIILAIKSKSLNVKAITTVSGNTSITNATNNALKILDLMDFSFIPVYKGKARPLEGNPQYSEDVHGEKGLEGMDSTPPKNTFEEKPALDFFSSYFCNNRKNTYIISLGPLTNIANFLINYPDSVSNIQNLIIMGGAVFFPGNITRHAEFNIFCDPKAADIVFNSSIRRITLVPLDVTKKVIFTPKHLDQIRRSSFENKKLKSFLIDSISYYQDYCITHSELEGCPLHDPLAIGECIDDTFTQKKPYQLKVGQKNDSQIIQDIHTNNKRNLAPGEIINSKDYSNFFNNNRPEIDVCLKVESTRFINYFLQNILS
jgi:purine nucleosidase